MVARIKQYFEKTSDQDWSGVYLNTKPKRDPSDVALYKSNPDPRDRNVLSAEEEAAVVSKFDSTLYAHPGFIGIDREYADENTLVINYNFETDESAQAYLAKANSEPDPTSAALLAEKNRVFEEKRRTGAIPTYIISSKIFYSNNSFAIIKSDVAAKLF